MPTVGFIGALLTAGPTPLPMISPSPLRVVELTTGEQISAELLDVNEQSMELRLRGGAVVEVPRAFVKSIAHLPGWQDVIYEDFETGERTGDDQPTRWTFTPPTPLPAGQFGWTTTRVASGSASGRVQFTFQRGKVTERVQLNFPNSNQAVTISGDLHFAQYPVRQTQDATRWTMIFDADRVQILAGNHVFASGVGTGVLTRVEVQRDANASVDFDDLLLQSRERKESSSRRNSPPIDDARDCLTFFDGNRFYGHVQRADGRQVGWKFGEREVITNWSDVRSIRWRTERLEQHPHVSGQIARVRFRSWWHLSANAPGDVLEVAIRRQDNQGYSMRHPLLGPFEYPADQVAEATPIFNGKRSVLLQGPLEFGQKRTEWKGSYESASSDQSVRRFLRVITTGVEPSGPKTFLGSPHLRELRAGRMTTELWWNHQRIAILNTFLSRHQAGSEIRIPIPRGTVRSGANAWEIRQTALTSSGTTFDSCQIGPVYLESERLDAK